VESAPVFSARPGTPSALGRAPFWGLVALGWERYTRPRTRLRRHPLTEQEHGLAPLDPVLGSLAEKPIIDRIEPRQLELIQKTVAKGLNAAETAMFLEIAAHQGLSPFAKEIWGAKSPGRDGGEGRVLIMVGRDGLRKIARNNGLSIDGDVVREQDQFEVSRGPSGRNVLHQYKGSDKERGEIVGAWCEVTKRRSPLGKTTEGFFYAHLSEYLPKNVSEKSVWSKQRSVMILAAAERQALRMACPLSGLLAEGEDARIGEADTEALPTAEIVAGFAASEALAGAILTVIDEAAVRGHAAYADVATVEMTLRGRSEAEQQSWVAKAVEELDAIPAPEPDDEPISDAEVVEDDVPIDDASIPDDQRRVEEAAQMEQHAQAKLDEADSAEAEDEPDKAAELRAEAEALHTSAAAMRDPNQDAMEV
jgi:hypothetical protein